MTMIKRYSEVERFLTFEERLNYLKLNDHVGHSTFGFDRWINQRFYRSHEWKMARDYVIVRDNGCDLGISGFEIYGEMLVHHINPMDVKHITEGEDWILDPEFLITTTQATHNIIHYGEVDSQMPKVVLSRKPGDTKLW